MICTRLVPAAVGAAVGELNGSAIRTTWPRSSRSCQPLTMNLESRGVVLYRVSPAPLLTAVVGRQCPPAGHVGPSTERSAMLPSKTQVVVLGSGGVQ